MSDYPRLMTYRIVLVSLEEAASIHRRLPESLADEYQSLWPESMQDSWRKCYDAIHGEPLLYEAEEREILFFHEAMHWLDWVNSYQRRILWMRANRVPWKIIVAEYTQDKTTLWREQRLALTEIASKLAMLDE